MRHPSPLSAALALLLLLPLAASAQIDPHIIPASGTIGNCSFVTGNLHFHCIPLYIAYLIQLIFSFIGTICLLEIIYGGYQIAMGGLPDFGDKESGKKRVQSALMGLAACILSFVIVDMLVSALISGPA